MGGWQGRRESPGRGGERARPPPPVDSVRPEAASPPSAAIEVQMSDPDVTYREVDLRLWSQPR